MKKVLVLFLLVLPMTVFAAPSVRVLGNKPAGSTNAQNTSVSATPARLSVTPNNASVSRVGTVRTKAKTGTLSSVKTGATSNAKSGTESRFPMIAPNHSYNSVSAPKPTSVAKPVSSEVDEDALVEKVVEKVVKRMEEKSDDIDDRLYYTISRDNPNDVLHKDAPSGWAYMWIEE